MEEEKTIKDVYEDKLELERLLLEQRKEINKMLRTVRHEIKWFRSLLEAVGEIEKGTPSEKKSLLH